MQPLYSTEQIRLAEQAAMQSLNISSAELMRRAGRAAFGALRRRWPELKRLRVFCGAGNNGGDGYVVATLALAADYQVNAYSLADNPTGAAQAAYVAFLQAGGKIEKFTGVVDIPADTLIVDALFGTGLNREPSGAYLEAIRQINASAAPVLALDTPSGLHADTGRVLGTAVKADMTVTFIALKAGLYTGMAADFTGDVTLASLDLPDAILASLPIKASLLAKPVLPKRNRCAHKGHFGHVLLIGGNHGYSGAIRLAGEAALRSGAGLVSIATRGVHSALLNLGRPELMIHGVEEPAALEPLLRKATVVVIGPGLGQDSWARALFAAVLESRLPCVMDADALNILAGQPRYNVNWVLTPHPGEAARLLVCATVDIGNDRYAAVAALQSKYGGVCVLKGAGSLVADGSQIYTAATGNPGMASGGMGDVLAGIIGGLLAQELSPSSATRLAVHAHGEAADAVAARQGERGMLASDLLPELVRIIND
ncbi:MAG: NAD(P)H-hydrate dehydratase [Methylomonas sp.]|jgi:NAD(P)H-hydrate epimerase